MKQHTPGPWRVEVNKAPCATSWVILADGDRPYIGATYGPRDHALANARLIAAAPDMLATLLDVDDYLDRQCSGIPPCPCRVCAYYLPLIRTTIARARGEVTP